MDFGRLGEGKTTIRLYQKVIIRGSNEDLSWTQFAPLLGLLNGKRSAAIEDFSY
jgi:hypothetical protein